jgi:pilus assembly protein CpaF
MTMMAGMDLGARAIREQIASAIQLIVHQARMKDGTRRITHVTEIVGMEGEVITMQDLFLFDYSAGIDPDGRFLGNLRSTGLRPRFVEKIAERGITVPADVFAPASGGRAA